MSTNKVIIESSEAGVPVHTVLPDGTTLSGSTIQLSTRLGNLLDIDPVDGGLVITATVPEFPETVDCSGNTVVAISDVCANSKLTDVVALLTNLGANTEQIEALQQANIAAIEATTEYIDQVESLLTTVRGNTENLETLLTQLGLNTDTVEEKLISIVDQLPTVDCTYQEVTENSQGIEYAVPVTQFVIDTYSGTRVDTDANTMVFTHTGVTPLFLSAPAIPNGTALDGIVVTIFGSVPNMGSVTFSYDGVETPNPLGNTMTEADPFIINIDGHTVTTGVGFGVTATLPIAGNLTIHISGSSTVTDVLQKSLSVNLDGCSKTFIKSEVAKIVDASVTTEVTNFPAVQPVSGTVSIDNFPAGQPISGTVEVGNFPAIQTVVVDNFPADQQIHGTVTVSNIPATQPVSAATLPLPTGASTEVTLAAVLDKLTASSAGVSSTTAVKTAAYTVAANYRSMAVTFIDDGTINGAAVPAGFTRSDDIFAGQYISAVALTGTNYIVTEVR